MAIMHSLPSLSSLEAFRAWRTDASQCMAVALDIARSHGLPHADPHLFSTGTKLVVALDDRLVLKIFPPMLRHQFMSELTSLRQLHGRLSVPIPEIVLDRDDPRMSTLDIRRFQGILGSASRPPPLAGYFGYAALAQSPRGSARARPRWGRRARWGSPACPARSAGRH